MTTALYPLLDKYINDAWVRLERDKITPWSFMTAGPPFRVIDFYGKQIAYQGIGFEGSPRHVFWGRYIEPFLEDLVNQSVNEALRLSAEKKQNARMVLPELAGLLKSVSHRALSRMAEIDRRLLGRGFPQKIPLRNVQREMAEMDSFIDRRIDAELTMLPKGVRINEIYKEHPFWFWLIPILVGAVIQFLIG